MKKPIPFGKYVLLERINVGGMAEVFKAKAFGVEGFERLVAVKRILPSIAEDQEFITMFIDEAKISVQLTHANIAQIFDLGKVNDSYFIAMEFVHGKDLRAIFDRARKRGEAVPVPMACYTAMKICEGLDYAHNKKDAAGRELNLVHRDVSPQNVLISYDGETKIIDFGIAKAAGKAGRTQAGILKGKFGYMSPEQVRGLPLDRRSDIFAVGIVLYELLTGERLFVGESDFSTLEKVRNVEIMPPSTYNRRIPEELEQIVLKALAKDVDDRYQTAMDLHDDLQSFMYTSGNFFSRKDLSAYMRKAFADEIAKESAREEEYRRMEANGMLPVVEDGASTPESGLEAFDDLEPIEASQPSVQMSAIPSANVRTPKKTVLGMPVVQTPPPPPPRVSGTPPPPPRPSMSAPGSLSTPGQLNSPPPPPPSSRPRADSVPSQATNVTTPGLDMDWDDDELSTQIYDKPEGLNGMLSELPNTQASAAYAGGAARPSPAPKAPFAQTSTPPAPVASSGLGAPSPFEQAPAPIGPEPTAVTRKSGGHSGILAALAAVAVLGLLAGGVWFFVMGSQPGSIMVTANPSDAIVFLDGEAVPSSSNPMLISNVEPGPHLLEVRRHGFETWATTVTVEPGTNLTVPPVVLVAAPTDSGSPAVAVPSTAAPTIPTAGSEPATAPQAEAGAGTGFALSTVPPGARVFVNETELTSRTPVQVSDLEPGTYQVRVDHGANYAPWMTQISVEQGHIVSLPPAVLALRAVTVDFTSEPSGAEVTLVRGSERRSIGRTPVAADVDVTGGPWTVRMERAGHEDYESVLTLPTGESRGAHFTNLMRAETRRVASSGSSRGNSSTQETNSTPVSTASAEPRASGGAGTLRINTRPWSQVFIDGRLIGNTPQMSISLPAGRHTVTLVNSDFDIRETITIDIAAGETTTRVLTLQPGG